MTIRVVSLCMLLCLTACTGKSKKSPIFSELTQEIDSIHSVEQKADTDTMQAETAEVMPANADESFADFFYNFASDSFLQRSRIRFPLAVKLPQGNQVIDKSAWSFATFTTGKDNYSLLFDHESDMELEKDTVLTKVDVEWIYLKERIKKHYHFARHKGIWSLQSIDWDSLPHPNSEAEDFFAFYDRFSSDSIFQMSRLHEPLRFVTIDPDDDFQILETTLEHGQWITFQPPMPKGILTNVNYGQRLDPGSNEKIIEIKGLGNGFNNTLYFRRYKGQWRLSQLEDLGD